MAPPSAVWQYFEKIRNGSMVKCNKCGKELKYNKSTTSLATHLKTSHKISLQLQAPTSAKRSRSDNLNQSDDEAAIDDPEETAGNKNQVRIIVILILQADCCFARAHR